jgi:hypothetical protein
VGAGGAVVPLPSVAARLASHPAARTLSSNGMNHAEHLEYLANFFICVWRLN